MRPEIRRYSPSGDLDALLDEVRCLCVCVQTDRRGECRGEKGVPTVGHQQRKEG